MKLRKRVKKRARIEMIPLIDVTFLLLVFFIYISMSMSISKGIPVILPEAASSLHQKEKHLAISIDKKGDCYVDRQKVHIKELAGYLRSKIKGNREVPVHILGDQRVPYRKIVQILDSVRESGLNSISLQTADMEAP